jgi:predicted RNA-binding Zn ribbon-like protein
MKGDNSLDEHELHPRLPRRLGGRLCLDFINTVDPRHGDHSYEYLKSYSDLVAWASDVDILTENEAQRLLEKASNHPAIATLVFQRALSLREALYQIFSDARARKSPDGEALEVLNATLCEGMAKAQILTTSNGFVWTWSTNVLALERMLWSVARSAAELLSLGDLMNVKECPGDDGCGWLFVDTSRNHRRRWCDMEGCGNRAKARRHYEHKKRSRVSGPSEVWR